MSEVNWYVVRTQPQAEARVQRGLREQCLEAYLPTVTRWGRGRGTRTRITRPLFVGYLFAGLEAASPEFFKVQALDGFLNFLGRDGRPIPVQFGKIEGEPDAFSIEGLRECETTGQFDFTQSKKITFRPGQPVRIIGGHFAGFMGDVIKRPADDERRIRLLMQAIGKGRSWPITVNLNQIEAA